MATPAPKPRYVYTQEIASMVFVCTGIKDPDEELAQFLEDVVRAEMAELVTQARAQAARRAVRTIVVEDLVFLVRHDRAKVNRLRSYLSWRDVRKKLKEPNEADDEIDGMEEPVSDKTLKVIKNTVRLPWELSDAWVDYLRGEDEPEDEVEAYEVNKQRLKEMDEVTDKMSKDEYEQYAQARQASFVYRKSKKFRDFLSLPSLLDTVAPLSDEVTDVLGFLAYECVRALCDAGTANRALLAAAEARAAAAERRRAVREGKKRGRDGDGDGNAGGSPAQADDGASPARKRPPRKGLEAPTTVNKARAPASSPSRKPLEIPTSLFSAPLTTAEAAAPAGTHGPASAAGADGVTAAEADAPELLQLQDVAQGYHAVQHAQGALKMGGMRNWRGGIARFSNRLL